MNTRTTSPHVAECMGVKVPPSPYLTEKRIERINAARYEGQEIAGALHVVGPEDRVVEMGAGLGIVGAVATAVILGGFIFNLGTELDVAHARSMAMAALVIASAAMTAALTRLGTRAAVLATVLPVASAFVAIQIAPFAELLHLSPLHSIDWLLATPIVAVCRITDHCIFLVCNKAKWTCAHWLLVEHFLCARCSQLICIFCRND